MMPSPDSMSRSSPSMRNLTEVTPGNWVTVYTTWAMAIRTANEPPPLSNSCDMSMVISVPFTSAPSNRVPAGTSDVTPAERSLAVGPASNAVMAL